ncbi:hypothetical protein Misp02_22140 [Microtetraspora sp. NBRC 16547]|nr:hypothetical protein Misp02_22140 [Microtetraspora sp. NBRC 16547]
MDKLDLLYAHAYLEDSKVPLEETVEAFAGLVEDGTVGHLGASNHWAWRLERARNLAAAAGLPIMRSCNITIPTCDREPICRLCGPRTATSARPADVAPLGRFGTEAIPPAPQAVGLGRAWRPMRSSLGSTWTVTATSPATSSAPTGQSSGQAMTRTLPGCGFPGPLRP